MQSKFVRVDLPQQVRDMILNKKRLNDMIINWSQNILRKQFLNVGGWQDTLLCQTLFASFAEESVQVHFTGKIHWVCPSSVSGYVQVYVSAASWQLTSSMKVQLSECYKSLAKEKKLEVELPPAQISTEESLCPCPCLWPRKWKWHVRTCLLPERNVLAIWFAV